MNNRKQLNKRGKNPRATFTQTTMEPPIIKVKAFDENGEPMEEEEQTIPNPKFGQKRKIRHKNFSN